MPLLVCLVASLFLGVASELSINAEHDSPSPAAHDFFFVQLADPQFGVKNAYGKPLEQAQDWSAEAALLEKAVEAIVKLKPAFVAMNGDMQQFYPLNAGEKNGVLKDHPAVGPSQAKNVKTIMSKLGSIPVKYLPGNHDIDDGPTVATLEYYRRTWGNNGSYSFRHGGVHFIVLNSQVYYDGTSAKEYEREQGKDLYGELAKLNSDNEPPRNIVVLTHIPPFGGDPNEGHGWGNWEENKRRDILKMVTSFKHYPTLWLCGHLHANARYKGPAWHEGTQAGKPIEIVISNAVGQTMQWAGQDPKTPYDSHKVSEILSTPEAGTAFEKFIMPGIKEGWLSTSPAKSGVRIVGFTKQGEYAHKWFTIEELEKLSPETVWKALSEEDGGMLGTLRLV